MVSNIYGATKRLTINTGTFVDVDHAAEIMYKKYHNISPRVYHFIYLFYFF